MRVGLSGLLASPLSGAFASFNIIDFDLGCAVVEAAEEAERPVVLGVASRHWSKVDAPRLMPALVRLVEGATVPIALHLDHAKPEEPEIINSALEYGFSSIMFDGSTLDIDRNIDQTRTVTAAARRYGADVEGELGAVAGEEGVADQGDLPDAELYTDPEAAQRFVSESGVNALAVAVGTAHGLYKREPDIRFDIIRAVHDRVPVPLVLHGATGVPEADIRKAIESGIRKINFFSGFLVAGTEQIHEQSKQRGNDYLGFKVALRARWKATALRQIELYSGA